MASIVKLYIYIYIHTVKALLSLLLNNIKQVEVVNKTCNVSNHNMLCIFIHALYHVLSCLYFTLTLSFIIPDMCVQIKECSALCVSFFNINNPPILLSPLLYLAPPPLGGPKLNKPSGGLIELI